MSRITNASARPLVDIIKTTGRKDKDSDVLMRAGVTTFKSSQNAEKKLMGLLKGVSDHGFKALRNILMGRVPADKQDITNLMNTKGMSQEQIDTAFFHIKTDTKGRYTAKNVEEAINKATKNPHNQPEQQARILGTTYTSKIDSESALQEPWDDYTPFNFKG